MKQLYKLLKEVSEFTGDGDEAYRLTHKLKEELVEQECEECEDGVDIDGNKCEFCQ